MKNMDMKICLAASAGGHLTELLQLEKAWLEHPHYYVSDPRYNAQELSKREKVFFVTVPRRNPLKLMWNFLQSLRIFLKEQPDMVISTGADVAMSTCWLAKKFGKKLVFIESYCRVNQPSESGKIAYQLADVFFVQWKENIKFYPNATYAGSVF